MFIVGFPTNKCTNIMTEHWKLIENMINYMLLEQNVVDIGVIAIILCFFA